MSLSLLEQYYSSIITIKKKYKEEESKKEEYSTKQKEFFTERDKISGLINGLDKELFRLNSQKEKMEESL